mmetsp:Transcript_32103/g.42329  ORF Transcript_32103/g.42329 Transcript_32103/m.42329 type:complete len:98 (-) Transcript_32103:510-803(-)
MGNNFTAMPAKLPCAKNLEKGNYSNIVAIASLFFISREICPHSSLRPPLSKMLAGSQQKNHSLVSNWWSLTSVHMLSFLRQQVLPEKSQYTSKKSID